MNSQLLLFNNHAETQTKLGLYLDVLVSVRTVPFQYSVIPGESAVLSIPGRIRVPPPPKKGENKRFSKLLIQNHKEHPSISLVTNFHRN